MGTINQLRSKLNAVNISELSEDAIEETKGAIIEKQKDQMRHGLNRRGEKIGKYKNDAYAREKVSMNPLAGFGNVDLKYTGDLEDEIFVNVREETFVIDSADSKTGGLIAKYGDPFGLGEESKSQYVTETLRPAFLKKIHEKTGL